MFIAILSTIIQGFGDVFWKKSLGYGVGGKAHDILSYPLGLLIVIYFFIVGIDSSNFTLLLIISSTLILIISVFITGLKQNIYKKEKISSVIPYTNVNKILTIILSFLILKDQISTLTLIITFIAIGIIIISSIDFKTFKFPKSVSKILIAEFLSAITALWSGWLIFNIGEVYYFTVFVFSGIIVLFLMSLFLGQLKTLKGLPKGFWLNRYIGSIGWISRFLSLVVIKNLGLSVTILLSFLGIGITLFLSFLFLGDKPSKKDLIVTIIVTTLVGIGFIYK